jgi:hypothetical protein
LLRITWVMVLLCARMLFVVARPIWRVAEQRPWLKAALLALFVLVFLYRPAIAYYWFWGSVIVELTLLGWALLFAKQDSLLAWLKRR